MKKAISLFLSAVLFLTFCFISSNAEIELEAKSVILIEQETGEVLYEKNADERLPPASVTKIMTMLLVMEAIDSGKINLTDMVSVSEKAASMGGSQVYLEFGEQMSVDELMKCVAVASANDAALALAEFVSGSEETFVREMNNKASELGMNNTNFENTNGLDDTTQNHYTSARDIAIMSRELLKYEKIFDYTTIWMDSVRNGEFVLTNTNRLIRFYKGANGLKTGSTSKAKFCLSASAKRDGMQLIAVVMASPTRDQRNAAATKLLDFGFSNYALYTNVKKDIESIKVIGGKEKSVEIKADEIVKVLKKGQAELIESCFETDGEIYAPVASGDVVGRVVYKINGEEIGSVNVYASHNVDRVDFLYQIKKILYNFLLY